MSNKSTFIGIVNYLKKTFPASLPIKVRRCRMPMCDKDHDVRLFGDCSKDDENFLIRINKDDEYSIQVDTLMHEWAHAVAEWDYENDEEDSHSDKWGSVYAQIYRNIIGD